MDCRTKIFTPVRYFHQGNKGFGYDQYAQYYIYDTTKYGKYKKITISGQFNKAAYSSISLYSQTKQLIESHIDSDFKVTTDNEENPYVNGDNSVFYYDNTITTNNTYNQLPSPKSTVISYKNNSTHTINIYRLDKETTQEIYPTGVFGSRCSSEYLYATPFNTRKSTDNNQDVAIILRMKRPNTFINSSDSLPYQFDKSMFDARYFSISSNVPRKTPSFLDFWSVNSEMLFNMTDEQGYFYIFFLPHRILNALSPSGDNHDLPPIYTWGRYTGYALGLPTAAIIFRYKLPNITWSGSPQHTICYNTTDSNQPVNPNMLGDYFPNIFMGTIDDFQHGQIGAVNKNRLWPGASA